MVEQCGGLGSRSSGRTPPGVVPPHVSTRCVPEGQRPECAGLTFFYHPRAEKVSLNKQKAPITRGKKDESTPSKMRKLRVTEHAINTAIRPPDAEATFTTRVTSGGLTPRLHGGPLHSCTTVRKEGQPGSWQGREQGAWRRLPHGHHHHQDTQDKASARPHFRTTRWAKFRFRRRSVGEALEHGELSQQGQGSRRFRNRPGPCWSCTHLPRPQPLNSRPHS